MVYGISGVTALAKTNVSGGESIPLPQDFTRKSSKTPEVMTRTRDLLQGIVRVR